MSAMAQTKSLPTTIRLSQENMRTLEPVLKLGLSCGEIVNEALKDTLPKRVEKRIKELKAALAEV